MKDADAPPWLPDLMPFGGDWTAYIEKVYAAFRTDLLDSRAQCRGRPVAVRMEPRERGKEAGFWHAISEGEAEDERTPDLRRCERVRWVRALIEVSDERVRRWESRRRSENRVLIALPDFSYVVVLADRRSYVQFITAFCVEREHRRAKLKQEWAAWTEAQKG